MKTEILEGFQICISVPLNSYFALAIFKEIALLWPRPNNFFFSTRFRETSRLMYKKSNSFVYKFVVNFQVF